MIRTARLQTHRRTEVINITELIKPLIGEASSGLAHVYIPHTTAALLVGEDDEELRADLVKVVENWLAGLRPFSHLKKNNPNAEAHIFSALGGNGVTMAIEQGELDLGTYQNLLLLEMDGPKEREIRCKVIGD